MPEPVQGREGEGQWCGEVRKQGGVKSSPFSGSELLDYHNSLLNPASCLQRYHKLGLARYWGPLTSHWSQFSSGCQCMHPAIIEGRSCPNQDQALSEQNTLVAAQGSMYACQITPRPSV